MDKDKQTRKARAEALCKSLGLPANHAVYELESGELVPLFEALYPIGFRVIRTDKKNAIIGDPRHCIEAHAIQRCLHSSGAEESWIGCGRDAYIVFRANPSSRPYKHALHFIIPAKSAKIRDAFDKDKSIKSADILLLAPTPGRTRAHRAVLNKRRQEELKNGTGKPLNAQTNGKKKKRRSRMERIGVRHRPRPQVVGTVTTFLH